MLSINLLDPSVLVLVISIEVEISLLVWEVSVDTDDALKVELIIELLVSVELDNNDVNSKSDSVVEKEVVEEIDVIISVFFVLSTEEVDSMLVNVDDDIYSPVVWKGWEDELGFVEEIVEDVDLVSIKSSSIKGVVSSTLSSYGTIWKQSL